MPTQIGGQARYAHIAQMVQRHLKTHNLMQGEFARQLGMGNGALISLWGRAAGAPGPAWRDKLAKALGVKPEELTAKDPKASKELGPVREALSNIPKLPVVRDNASASPTFSKQHAQNTLSYVANGDGTATLMLRARLPMDVAKPLFRTLMDTNIDQMGDEPWQSAPMTAKDAE